jgi:antitoxin (DNA-binding transcriptional repressor) of toxin-antitoxin stability system
MSEIVNIHEANTHLSRPLESLTSAEAITIPKTGRPIAKLTAIQTRPRHRVPGNDVIVIHPDFDDPLPEFEPDYAHPDDPLREQSR